MKYDSVSNPAIANAASKPGEGIGVGAGEVEAMGDTVEEGESIGEGDNTGTGEGDTAARVGVGLTKSPGKRSLQAFIPPSML